MAEVVVVQAQVVSMNCMVVADNDEVRRNDVVVPEVEVEVDLVVVLRGAWEVALDEDHRVRVGAPSIDRPVVLRIAEREPVVVSLLARASTVGLDPRLGAVASLQEGAEESRSRRTKGDDEANLAPNLLGMGDLVLVDHSHVLVERGDIPVAPAYTAGDGRLDQPEVERLGQAVR